jgi:hypothetical protein
VEEVKPVDIHHHYMGLEELTPEMVVVTAALAEVIAAAAAAAVREDILEMVAQQPLRGVKEVKEVVLAF